MKCPKCGYQSQISDTECPRCGIVYNKYKLTKKGDFNKLQEKEVWTDEKFYGFVDEYIIGPGRLGTEKDSEDIKKSLDESGNKSTVTKSIRTIRLKKIAISILMAIVIAAINDNPKSAGVNWIFIYAIASFFQYVAIEKNRPQYKKVFKHNLWFTAIILAIFSVYLLSFPQDATLKFGSDFTNSGILLITILGGYIIGYINNAIIGLLTVFWLTKTGRKQDVAHSGVGADTLPQHPKTTSEATNRLSVAGWFDKGQRFFMDKRQKIIIILVIIIALSVYFAIRKLSESNRYYLQTSGSVLYKIDRKTGKTWLVYGGKETPVTNINISPKEKAISLTKNSYIFGSSIQTEKYILSKLKKRTDAFKIIGWKAKEKEKDTYLVSFTYELDGKEVGYFFEVSLPYEVVRKIELGTPLAGKYGIVDSSNPYLDLFADEEGKNKFDPLGIYTEGKEK